MVGKDGQLGDWVLLSENREAVLAALERGESDGILPAASGAMDRFAGLLNKSGILRVLGGFADYRSRESIPAFLFCNLLLHKAVFRLDSLSQIEPFLFSSPDALRMLGFNMRQIEDGFYSGSKERPLNVESVGDFFAACRLQDFQTNQEEVLGLLIARYPKLFRDASLVMDCIDVRIPAGKGRKQAHLEICVICLLSEGECLPVLWSIIDANSQADVIQGKALVEKALAILGRKVKRLIVDRGFLSGKWIAELKHKGIDTVIGLKTDMVLYTDMLSLVTEPETVWLPANLPKYGAGKPVPTQRHIAYVSDLETWDSCGVPLAGIVIRDTYPDKVIYQCVVTTDLTAEPEQIHEWIRSRWQIEETFMQASRYGGLNNIGSCRKTVGAAIAHFVLLAYTLLRLFAREEVSDGLDFRRMAAFPGIELVAYWKDYYAIIFASEFMEIIAQWPPGIQTNAQARQKAFEQALLRAR
jgi:hypothetical protein